MILSSPACNIILDNHHGVASSNPPDIVIRFTYAFLPLAYSYDNLLMAVSSEEVCLLCVSAAGTISLILSPPDSLLFREYW